MVQPCHGWSARESDHRFFALPVFYCWRFSRVPVVFGIMLACTPERKYPICSPNNGAFLLRLLIHSPGTLCLQCLYKASLWAAGAAVIPPSLLWATCYCWQALTEWCNPEQILDQYPMPNIVFVPVVCYNVYSDFIFFSFSSRGFGIWSVLVFLLLGFTVGELWNLCVGICARLLSFLLYVPDGLGNFLFHKF